MPKMADRHFQPLNTLRTTDIGCFALTRWSKGPWAARLSFSSLWIWTMKYSLEFGSMLCHSEVWVQWFDQWNLGFIIFAGVGTLWAARWALKSMIYSLEFEFHGLRFEFHDLRFMLRFSSIICIRELEAYELTAGDWVQWFSLSLDHITRPRCLVL